MKNPIDNETELLRAKTDDLFRRAESGRVVCSGFLTPGEQHRVREYLERTGRNDKCFEYGGYDDAERKKFFFLPEYISALAAEEGDFDVLESISDDVRDAICALSIEGSGFTKLGHRDFLGALMALGIERNTLGDLVLRENGSAIILCEPVIADYLLRELKKIGSDSVKVAKVTLPENFSADRKFMTISDTVASERLDCVVAAITNTSRNTAQTLVTSGLVELDYEAVIHSDKAVDGGSVISVRGYGKYIVRSIGDRTKKGRLRLLADKYI